MEITEIEQKKEKRMKRNMDSLRDLRDNIKRTGIHIIGAIEGEDREKGAENISEDIIAENVPNLGKGTDIQVWEAQTVPNTINPKRTTPRHTLINGKN